MTITYHAARRVVDNTGSVNTIDLTFLAESAVDVHVYAGVSADPTLPNIVEMVQGVDYTLSGIGTLSLVATITNPSGWGNYSRFAILVKYPVTQPNDVDVGGPFGLRFENALDRQTYMLQSFFDDVSRAIKMPLTNPVGQDLTLEPAPGQILGWNDEGTQLIPYPTVSQSIQAALDAAEDAHDAADQSSDFADLSSDFADASAASALLSQKFATNPEDVVVQSGLFSALHWAAKAAAQAAAAAGSVAAVVAGFANAINTAAAKATPVAADRIGFYDTVGAALKRITFGELVTWLYPQVGPEYVIGLTISTNTTTPNTQMDVAAGEHRKGGLFGTAVAMTKRIDQVWAAGTGGGWRDSATAVAVSTDYYIHSIRNNSTGALDTISSLSATAPTVPGGYTLVGRVGHVRTDGSGNLLQRNQSGNKVVYKNPGSSFTGSGASATALITLADVPTGLSVDALVSGAYTATGSGSDGSLYLWDALVGSVPPGGGCGLKVSARANLASEIDASQSSSTPIRTSATGQVYRKVTVAGTASYNAGVDGYVDYQIPRLGA